jgi:hypothetical protein
MNHPNHLVPLQRKLGLVGFWGTILPPKKIFPHPRCALEVVLKVSRIEREGHCSRVRLAEQEQLREKARLQ